MNSLRRFLRVKPITLSDGSRVQPPRSMTPFIVALVMLLAYLSGVITDFDFSVLAKRGYQFFVILQSMFPPDFGYAHRALQPLIDTVKMSFLGSIIGSTVAVPFAIFSSTNINPNRTTLTLIRLFLSIVRTLPVLIIALIATYVFGIGTFAGTVAIAIFTFGIVSKMLYEQIETVNMAAFGAMEAMGMTKIQAFTKAIIPQVIPSYLSISLYSFEINVRYAAILGYVGAGGIGLILDEQIGWRYYDRAGMILVMLFVAVVLIESTSRRLRERLM